MPSTMSPKIIPLYPLLLLAKKYYMNLIENIRLKEPLQIDSNDWITLYHGTTADKIPSILKYGIKPNTSGYTNWNDQEFKPSTKLTYLTDTWHHFYAAIAYKNVLNKRFGDMHTLLVERQLATGKPHTEEEDSAPCIIEVKVQKKALLPDEDFFLTKEMNNRMETLLKNEGILKDGVLNQDAQITTELFEKLGLLDLGYTSLEFNGATAHYGEIPPEQIISFTVFGSPLILQETLIQEENAYHQGYFYWQEGLGKAKLSENQLQKINKFPLTKKYEINQLPKNKEVERIIVSYPKNNISMKVQKIIHLQE